MSSTETSRFALIVGCGRLGSTVAVRLERAGYDVVVLDTDPSALEALPTGFGGRGVVGSGLDLAGLERANVREVGLVVTTLPEDGQNLALAAIVQQAFQVRHVVARVRDPVRLTTASSLGIDAVCPTLLAAAACMALLPSSDLERPCGPPVGEVS